MKGKGIEEMLIVEARGLRMVFSQIGVDWYDIRCHFAPRMAIAGFGIDLGDILDFG